MALINCPECGKSISDKAPSCPNCGMPFYEPVPADPEEASSAAIRCPKCHSTNLHAGRKGFSGGKALVGVVTLGTIGALAGMIGRNQIEVTCLSCGHRFNPVKEVKRERERQMMEDMSRNNPVGLVVCALSGALAFILLFVSGVSIWWSVLLFLAGVIIPQFTERPQ